MNKKFIGGAFIMSTALLISITFNVEETKAILRRTPSTGNNLKSFLSSSRFTRTSPLSDSVGVSKKLSNTVFYKNYKNSLSQNKKPAPVQGKRESLSFTIKQSKASTVEKVKKGESIIKTSDITPVTSNKEEIKMNIQQAKLSKVEHEKAIIKNQGIYDEFYDDPNDGKVIARLIFIDSDDETDDPEKNLRSTLSSPNIRYNHKVQGSKINYLKMKILTERYTPDLDTIDE